jgi:hypothetical protein
MLAVTDRAMEAALSSVDPPMLQAGSDLITQLDKKF